MHDYGHWSTEIVGEFDPNEFFGFIYCITQISSGKKYIGRKQFAAKRKRTKSNPSKIKSSDWKFYTSSSDLLNDLIEEHGKDDFLFEITMLCTGKCMLTYEEERAQILADVLRARLPNGEKMYFNKTIGFRNFAGLEKQTDAAKEKNRLAHLGKKQPWVVERNQRPITEETRTNMRTSAIGRTATVETREKQSKAHLGTIQNSDWVEKRVASHRGRKRPQETCDKIAALKWWTDGVSSKRSPVSPGDNWRLGQSPAQIAARTTRRQKSPLQTEQKTSDSD